MQPIPKDVLTQFDDVLKQRNVPIAFRADYRKWLWYFLDYFAKYHPPVSRSEQVRLFVEKLRSKNQSANKLKQAADAVSLFFASHPRKRSVLEKPENTGLKLATLPVSPPSAALRTGLKAEMVGGSTSSIEVHKRVYDLRTIQMLLGHAGIRITMIYTHCVPSRTIKDVASPLDF